jgi:hypothetical protein
MPAIPLADIHGCNSWPTNRVYGRLGARRAHATKTAQTIVSPTTAGNGTSDVGIDTSTASFVIDPSGNSDIREPFRLVQSMQNKIDAAGNRVSPQSASEKRKSVV